MLVASDAVTLASFVLLIDWMNTSSLPDQVKYWLLAGYRQPDMEVKGDPSELGFTEMLTRQFGWKGEGDVTQAFRSSRNTSIRMQVHGLTDKAFLKQVYRY